MEEVHNMIMQYSRFTFELQEERKKFADAIVKKMIRLNDARRYIAYVTVITQMTGSAIPNAEILLEKIVNCDLLGEEIMNEERTIHYDLLPEWSKKIIKQ
jgi:hypothetical protein